MKEIGAGRGKLYASLKELRLKWGVTEETWHDPVRQDFETNVWEPLDLQAASALRGIDRLNHILVQAREECS
jgi:hypothetical protein